MVEKGAKVCARFSLIHTTPNPNGVETYDFFDKIRMNCKLGQLIGKSELLVAV